MARSPLFPLEIFRDIIHNFHLPEDRECLALCSLVSQTFREAAQAILFHEITVYFSAFDHITSGSVSALYDLFIVNPALGLNVRKFLLKVHVVNDTNRQALKIVKMLPRVQTLRITSFARRPLDPSLATVLTTILRLPTLRSVTIDGNSGLPMPLLLACQGVERLELTGHDPFEEGVDPASDEYGIDSDNIVRGGNGQLLWLKLFHQGVTRQFNSLVHLPSPVFSLDHLRVLEITIRDHAEVRQTQQIIDLSSSTLHGFYANISGD
ncbi:hypothetical protein DXG01_005468 [Tephrocybe rancida]|nr:hypothetical protein DXG01_005468 [Tephrocybe rancida]